MARQVITPENLSTDFLIDPTLPKPVSLNLAADQFYRDPVTGEVKMFNALADIPSIVSMFGFVPLEQEPIWASPKMKFQSAQGAWQGAKVRLAVYAGQSQFVRHSLPAGSGASEGNVFAWFGGEWVIATPSLVGDIAFTESHYVSFVDNCPVFIVHGAVAGTAIGRWVPGGDLYEALKAKALLAIDDLLSRGYVTKDDKYRFSQGEGEYALAPLGSLSTERYPSIINGVQADDYLGKNCRIVVNELLRQAKQSTVSRVNREWRRLKSAGYSGLYLVPSDGVGTEDPTDGSVQVVHYDAAGRFTMGLRAGNIDLGLSDGVTSGDEYSRSMATGERIWKERAYTPLLTINIGPGNVYPQVLNLLASITGTPILWDVGGVTTEVASGPSVSLFTYTGATDATVVIWGPTDANDDQGFSFSAVAVPGQGAIRSFIIHPLARLKGVYISGHLGLMHNVNPSTWGPRMEYFRLDAAPLVTFIGFAAAEMARTLALLTFTSVTPVPPSVIEAITTENTKRGNTIAVTFGFTPAGYRNYKHFATFENLTTAIADGYRETNGQIISLGDAGAQTLYWLIADSVAAGVGGIAPAGWRLAVTSDAARIAALEALGGNGLIIRKPVDLATTGNITLSGEQLVDGRMTAGNDVLVKDQTIPSQNGPYTTGAGAWVRRADMDAAGEVKGTAVYVSGGTINAGRRYYTGSTVTTIGTDPIVWVMESDSAFILAQIAAITVIANNALQAATDAGVKATIWEFIADAPEGAAVPDVVTEAGRVLAYNATGQLPDIENITRALLWDFSAENADGYEVPILVPELDPTKMLFAASMISGSATSTAIIRFMTDDGQSTGEGQAGSSAATIYGTAVETDLLTLRRGALADIWLGMTTSGGVSLELNGADVTSIGPLIPQIASTGTHGTTASEGFARALLKSGSGPIAVLSNAEGGQSITNLLPGAPGGYYAFANITTWMTRAQAVKPSGSRLVYDWLLMDQGQSNTGTTTLGAQHEAYRVAVQTQAQSIFGQTEALRMITWQPSSFHSSSVGVRSILDYALAHADDGLFICGGPTYGLPWSSDFLHNTSLGYAMRGEAAAGIQRRVEETGIYLPLHFISATVTGTNTITAKLSEAAVIDITDAFVASIANYGIEATGGTVTAVTLIGDTAIITTAGAAASVTALKIGLNPQSSPDRLAANIPRTNLRARAGLGSYSWGGLIKAWACHQQITVTS